VSNWKTPVRLLLKTPWLSAAFSFNAPGYRFLLFSFYRFSILPLLHVIPFCCCSPGNFGLQRRWRPSPSRWRHWCHRALPFWRLPSPSLGLRYVPLFLSYLFFLLAHFSIYRPLCFSWVYFWIVQGCMWW